MIKKLQRKFILITMGSLLLVMTLLIGAINGINLYRMEQKFDGAMELISENQGQLPKFEGTNPSKFKPRMDFEMNEETPFVTRYFVVELDGDKTTDRIDTSHIAISSEDAAEYAQTVMNSGRNSGSLDVYKYRIIEQDDGYMVIFIFCRDDINTAKKFLITSCEVALVTLILMFLLVSVFSRRAIRPIIESMEKQKQFITDAGHEIKTPIAIISANADVLQLTQGESEWITSIRNQTRRLDKLVKELLLLSKLEEGDVKRIFTEFTLSESIYETVSSFEAVAEMSGKTFILDIQPGLKLYGEESSIRQLVSTLADNAMKYSPEGGTIKISLASVKRGIRLEVYNTTDKIELRNLDQLFDRFYRPDSSRSRETGGYGIGLSIAKSITEAHHGKISVKSEDGKSICFTVILSSFKVGIV